MNHIIYLIIYIHWQIKYIGIETHSVYHHCSGVTFVHIAMPNVSKGNLMNLLTSHNTSPFISGISICLTRTECEHTDNFRRSLWCFGTATVCSCTPCCQRTHNASTPELTKSPLVAHRPKRPDIQSWHLSITNIPNQMPSSTQVSQTQIIFLGFNFYYQPHVNQLVHLFPHCSIFLNFHILKSCNTLSMLNYQVE